MASIEIEPNTKAVHKQPNPVPRVYLDTFKTQLDH